MKLISLINKIKCDKNFRIYLSVILSFFATFLFTLYNGLLGVLYESLWNISICIYYILLLILRMMLLQSEIKIKKGIVYKNIKKERTKYIVFSFLLLVLNIALVIPISLMVLNQKEIHFTLIPAIGMATYTTYKITMSSINYVKTRKSNDYHTRQIRTINFIDALVSILTLQHVLIIVASTEESSDMFILSAVSSFTIFVVIIIISIVSFFKIKQVK